MKKFGTKLVAVATATAMAFAFTPAVAFAADSDLVTTSPAGGSTSGSGDVEGYVDTDVFAVVLPTITTDNPDTADIVEKDTTFDFILDPQGLIAKTSEAAYSGKTFEEDASLFFENKAGEPAKNYSSSSDSLTATNKGTVDVDVTLTAAADLDSFGSAKLTTDNTFADDNTTSVYLALKSGSNTKALSADTGKAVITDSLDKAGDGAYEYTYDTSGASPEYKYSLKSNADSSLFKSISFNLTGACNTTADWSDAKNIKPSVDVSWTLAKHVDRYLAETTITAANSVLNVSLPEGVTISAVKLGGDAALTSGNHYTYDSSAGTVTFQSAHIAKWKDESIYGGKIVFEYSDGKTEEVTMS